MANPKTLIPEAHKLTLEDQSNGGKRSGEVRREKATMKQTLKLMLDEVADIEGNDKGLTYKQLATIGLLKGAILGNSANYKTILETTGEIEGNSSETPSVQINIVDNNNLEKILYDEDNNKSQV